MRAELSRREMIRRGAFGLGVLAGGGLILAADAKPTESSGTLGGYGDGAYGKQSAAKPAGVAAGLALTEDNILGPYHRPGAPFRAKITPPLEPGVVLVIAGRVWGHDTKKPLTGAVLDIWQANKDGRYDNDDPAHPPAKDVYKNRARLVTDENGYYEYETVHPGRYLNGDQFRPAHIHYWIRAAGYKELVTQLYFKGDPFNKVDPFIKESLIIALKEEKISAGTYEVGNFDVVLGK